MNRVIGFQVSREYATFTSDNAKVDSDTTNQTHLATQDPNLNNSLTGSATKWWLYSQLVMRDV